jgi:hypothetical protein
MAELPTSSTIKRIVVATLTGRVRILFGSDPEKNDPFEAAAWYLHKRLQRVYKNSAVTVEDPQNVDSCAKLMEILLESAASDAEKFRELHIFSHAWPTGLSLNYGATPGEPELKDLEKIYGKRVRQHIGGSDTDQFHANQLRVSNFQYLSAEQIQRLRARFAEKALIRLWGCDSGAVRRGSSDEYATIAGTLAQYAGVTGYGAPAKSNFYAFIDDQWTTEHKPVGRKAPWPFELRPYQHAGARQCNEFAPTVAEADLVRKVLKAKQPYLSYSDAGLDTIAHLPGDPERFELQAGSYVLISLVDGEDAVQTVTLHKMDGTQVPFDRIGTVEPHTEWELSADRRSVTMQMGRNDFGLKLHAQPALTRNATAGQAFYLKIAYAGAEGPVTFEGKQQRFIIR